MIITIKKATLEDIEPLAVLFDNYRNFYKKTPDIKGAQKFLSERIEKNESKVFVAQDDQYNLLGFVQLYPIFSSTLMKRLWLLNDLYVAPEYRRQNIAILLIERAKQLVEETNACGILLETEKTNEIGNKLYSKTDFQLDNEHNYYFWNYKQ